MELTVEPRALRFREPLQTAYSTLQERQVLLICIQAEAPASNWTAEGPPRGYGEAAPLAAYDHVAIEQAAGALAHYKQVLSAAGDITRALCSTPAATVRRLVEQCRSADPLPQALAAIDAAAWDLAGKLRQAPVHALLAEAVRDGDAANVKTTDCQRESAEAASDCRVPVNGLISALEPSQAAGAARKAVAAGHRCLKLKVGVGADFQRVQAVRREVGASIALRLDANGAWDVQRAKQQIQSLAAQAIELIEEPVHDLQALAQLRTCVTVPIAIDESACLPDALSCGAADLVCLKLSRCGGITALLDQAAAAARAGIGLYIASSLEGPLGTAAGLHSALALGRRHRLAACGLATMELFADVLDFPQVKAGSIALPQLPGLGVAAP